MTSSLLLVSRIRTILTRKQRTFSTAAPQPSFWSLSWQAYNRQLHDNPLVTKAGLAALIFFCSDSATQYLLPQSKKWDASRALSGAGFGIIATSWLHFWWGFLERAVNARVPMAQYRLANTITKVVIDQGIGAPFYIYSYYVITNFLHSMNSFESLVDARKSWKDNNDKAADLLWPTMMQHWKIWPAVHSVNFYFMPLHHRVLVQNSMLVFWSGYLSYLNHGGTSLMTPDEEVKVTIIRRETQRKLEEEMRLAAKKREEMRLAANKQEATKTARAIPKAS